MEEPLFLSEQHPSSGRRAIIEDDGSSVWLYLTAPHSTKPTAHCWICNRVPAPAHIEFGRGDTPVVPAKHVVSPEPSPALNSNCIRLLWCDHGEAVALLHDGELLGYIAQPDGPGYSRSLKAPSPFGSPIDQTLFAEIFRQAPPTA